MLFDIFEIFIIRYRSLFAYYFISISDEIGSRKRRRQDGDAGKFMEGVSDDIHPVPATILRELQQKCSNLSGTLFYCFYAKINFLNNRLILEFY